MTTLRDVPEMAPLERARPLARLSGLAPARAGRFGPLARRDAQDDGARGLGRVAQLQHARRPGGRWIGGVHGGAEQREVLALPVEQDLGALLACQEGEL